VQSLLYWFQHGHPRTSFRNGNRHHLREWAATSRRVAAPVCAHGNRSDAALLLAHNKVLLDMETTHSHFARAAIALAALVVTAAYASSPVADENIAVATAAVQRAEQSGAPQAAPVEFASARDKLARAVKANADRQRNSAIALAAQATLDAQVAEAVAQKERAAKAAAEFDASMATLRQESNRTSTTAQ
jgi:hypothetical protein